MKIFVTGSCGQIGSAVINELIKRKHYVAGCDTIEKSKSEYRYYCLDVSNLKEVHEILSINKPDVVIHCAECNDIIYSEIKENYCKIRDINFVSTENLANVCKQLDCTLIYMSTDNVFDGEGNEAWKPDCKYCNPKNMYGRTKYFGELAVSEILSKYYIIRTSLVFGPNGSSVINQIIDQLMNRIQPKLLNNQVGVPTYSCDLARIIVDMAEQKKYGYYHVTNEGNEISVIDLVYKIQNMLGDNTVYSSKCELDKDLIPNNIRLDTSKIVESGFEPLPEWCESLRKYIDIIHD